MLQLLQSLPLVCLWCNFSCFSTMLLLLYSCLCHPFSFFCSAVFLFSFRFMFWCSIVFGFVCFSWEWLLSKSTLFMGQIGLIRRSSGGWSLTICSVCMIPNQFWISHFVSLVWPCPRCARGKARKTPFWGERLVHRYLFFFVKFCILLVLMTPF